MIKVLDLVIQALSSKWEMDSRRGVDTLVIVAKFYKVISCLLLSTRSLLRKKVYLEEIEFNLREQILSYQSRSFSEGLTLCIREDPY